MEDSKLIFSLDLLEEGPVVAFSRERPGALRGAPGGLSLGMDLATGTGPRQRSQAFRIPHSPSSPGSLADLSTSSEDLPLSGLLVKSCSTELETGAGVPARAKPPPLSLVKSLSTEISYRGEPQGNLSKSDSKLHMHPWKQLTPQRAPAARREAGAGAGAGEAEGKGEVWAAGSPGTASPLESRGSSLIAELEDTRRKFSEAMQDPMSMFSKMMGDEGSPKQGRAAAAVAAEPSVSQEAGGGGGSPVSEDAAADARLKLRRRPQKRPRKRSRSPEPRSGDHGDGLQAPALRGRSGGSPAQPPGTGPGVAVPRRWLFLVGLLTFAVLVLPLPSYVTGLSVGVACGFFLGLVVVYLFSPRRPAGRRNRWNQRNQRNRSQENGSADEQGTQGERPFLEGWMNEVAGYDPATFQPSHTHSVYAALEGGRLRLSVPRAGAPRRAAFDQTPPEGAFLRSRTYQLAGCKVSLLPAVLARKRVWNRKYPICLVLAPGVQVEVEEEVEEEEKEEAELQLPGSEGEERAAGGQAPPDPPRPPQDPLYLFGRTGREKEEWFQHLLSASREPGPDGSPSREEAQAENLAGAETVREGAEEPPGAPKAKVLLDYASYMSHLIGPDGGSPAPSPCPSDHGSPLTSKRLSAEEPVGEAGGPEAEDGAEPAPGGSPAEGHPVWINALVGRIFWDFLREKYWSDKVAHKIQRKLSKIRLPHFMNELTLADLDVGAGLPEVLSTSKPSLDQRGLWLELDVAYMGGLQMTLETKMDLCKLGKEGWARTRRVPPARQEEGSKPRLCVLADSDEESSSAGSSDEEAPPPAEPQTPPPPGDRGPAAAGADGLAGGGTGRRLLRFVDKIAKSKYFQKATENEFIRKKIEEMSNTPLMLSVEVLELSGTLAVNIPPPPTDRIWYSFRGPPRLDLRVRPMLGEREVTLTHVTEWIEKKLQCEFQKVFVMPNMDDLYLPLMTPAVDTPPPRHPSPARESSSRGSSVDSQEYMSE